MTIRFAAANARARDEINVMTEAQGGFAHERVPRRLAGSSLSRSRPAGRRASLPVVREANVD
jgi:hypothetical protein